MDDAAFRKRESAAEQAFANEPVLFAYLFGSHARGQEHRWSDIDVAVYMAPDSDHGDTLDLSLRLAQKLATASGLGWIEVAVLNEAPLPLVGRAIQERRVLFKRDEPARCEFESLNLREFFDFQIHAVPLDRHFLREIAEGRR